MRKNCARCNHSSSFHDGGGEGTCFALGCSCQAFVDETPQEASGPDREALSALSRDDLRELAKRHGVPIPKTKDQLVERLIGAGVSR